MIYMSRIRSDWQDLLHPPRESCHWKANCLVLKRVFSLDRAHLTHAICHPFLNTFEIESQPDIITPEKHYKYLKRRLILHFVLRSFAKKRNQFLLLVIIKLLLARLFNQYHSTDLQLLSDQSAQGVVKHSGQ